VDEFVLLDTCNRWELYFVGQKTEILEKVWEAVVAIFPLEESELKSISAIYRGCGMMHHLFEVCSGVDSQMVGETEILGQVKSTYQAHASGGQSGPILSKVFSRAFQAAKIIRTETDIGRGQVSIGNISVDLAQRIFGNLRSCRVLLIGSGEVGRLVATSMVSREAKALSVTSRKRENAQSLADELGAQVLPFETIAAQLGEFDIILSCTSATEPVVRRESIESARRGRAHKPLFLIDLAMPRDIEPTIGRMPQVFLYNLDDVSSIANENIQMRFEEIEQCRQLLSRRAWVAWLEVLRRYKLKEFRLSHPRTEVSETAHVMGDS
jgi:glutamyl-tRNA reductase